MGSVCESILNHLDRLIHQLNHLPGRIGEALRSNDFLTQLRPQLANQEEFSFIMFPLLRCGWSSRMNCVVGN